MMMPLHVLSAGSTLHGLRSCAGLAVQAAGCPIEIATDHGHNIRDAILRGTATADVVLLPADMVERLAAAGLVRHAVELGTVSIGGAVRAGARAPVIGTMAELRAALLTADAVLLTSAPTGDHLFNAIARMDLVGTLAPKALRFDTSSKLLAHLAVRSDDALGFSPETEIRAGEGVTWVGDIPKEIQIALPYAGALLTRSRQAEAAQALLAFLTTAPARGAFMHSGIRRV
jgi:molybdate transport system substrate-binding protein